MTAAVAHPFHMHHYGSDLPCHTPSFSARRSATSSLPNFELPPPTLAAFPSKYQPCSAINTSQSHSSAYLTSAGNLLTPPNSLPGDGPSPVSSSVSNNVSGSSHGMQGYSPSGSYWSHQPQAAHEYGYSAASTAQWVSSRVLQSPPSFDSANRSASYSTPSADDSPASQYETNQLPPFAASLQMTMPTTLPGRAPVQQQNSFQPAYAHGHASESSSPSQHSPPHSQDSFHSRTPSYTYHSQSASAPPQQTTFSYPCGLSPTHSGSPDSITQHHHSRLSLQTGHCDMSPMQSVTARSPHEYQRPFGHFSLPAIHGPVLSNLHSPNGQMTLVNGMPGNMMPGFHSGHAGSMQPLYGMQHMQTHQQTPTPDRPFKCDQCVQSFNRNHDLKRHKRIHLAVKPYPCGYCDKSFSRKDALKRHILVKGCGKAEATNVGERQVDSKSPAYEYELKSENVVLDGLSCAA